MLLIFIPIIYIIPSSNDSVSLLFFLISLITIELFSIAFPLKIVTGLILLIAEPAPLIFANRARHVIASTSFLNHFLAIWAFRHSQLFKYLSIFTIKTLMVLLLAFAAYLSRTGIAIDFNL